MIRFGLDGSFSITYSTRAEPEIQRNHVDGPLLLLTDGTLHWLTWRERIALFFGRTDAKRLGSKINGDRP